MPNNVLYSVGHSNVSIEKLIGKLQEHQIEILVDVRTSPKSRWPQFTQDAIAQYLAEAGIKYVFRGKNLGGKGGNIDFHETVDELTDWVENGRRVAVMCSEGNPNDCHRKYMLEPEFKDRGVEMYHILHAPRVAEGQIPMFVL